jgi:kumamolisin
VSTGDRGAFGCTPDGDFNTLSTNVLSGVPNVTAVGGTYALLSSNGSYFKEAAWGEPVEQWGSGGGPSMFWPLPSWQVAPGSHNQFSDGKRQNPDISANADGESGWDIFAGGSEQPVGGTSAAAPFWAGITALIDQNLAAKNLRSVGFANPALYVFAQNPAGLPAPPYHDVTVGTNLYYPATPGWDFATGLGSPDVGALAEDFEWYERAHSTG